MAKTKKNNDDGEDKKIVFWDLMNLKDINFEAKKGEFIAIIGGVGAGKSSFVKAIVGNMTYVDSSTLEKLGDIEIP